MKTLSTLLICLATSAIIPTSLFADQFAFPKKENALFLFTLPETWEKGEGDEETFDANSANEHIQIMIWELESKEAAKDLKTDLKEMLKEYAKDIKLKGKAKEVKPGGMDGLFYEGSAVDSEDDSKIEFVAVLVTTETRAAVIYFEADAEATKEELEDVSAIFKSIAPVSGYKVSGALAVAKDAEAATEFEKDTAKIIATFTVEGVEVDDKAKGIYIIEDVGDAAPKNTKVFEAELKATANPMTFTFEVAKPKGGWPPGTYRVELHINDNLVETLNFTVTGE